MEINPKKAYEILMNGKNINPTGTWVEHSIRVGQAAERIAKKIGISQVQVSRMEKKILNKLRKNANTKEN